MPNLLRTNSENSILKLMYDGAPQVKEFYVDSKKDVDKFVNCLAQSYCILNLFYCYLICCNTQKLSVLTAFKYFLEYEEVFHIYMLDLFGFLFVCITNHQYFNY